MRSVLVVAGLLLVTWLALGQAPTPGPAAGPRIAVVHADRVMAESDEGKAAQAELERKFAPRQKQLQASAAEIERLQTEFQQRQATFSDAERQRRAAEVQQKQKALERLNEDVTADFNAAREETLGRLAKRVSAVVQKFGTERQYSLIFDAAQAGTLYAGAGADLTDQVIAAYNQQFPLKPAAPAK